VTIAEVIVFITSLSFAENWRYIVALLIGGVNCCPLGCAYHQENPS